MTPLRGVSFTALIIAAFCASCGADLIGPTGNEVQERVSGTAENSWQNADLVRELLSEAQAIRVNARTNYATYYVGGKPVSKWKVATGRLDDPTPKGTFRIHHKESCPPWNNGRGKKAGPCAADNPLGKKAVWFHQGALYGLHGVNDAGLNSVTTNDPRQRDASGGCVRNHPSNIEFVYANVAVGTPVVIGLWQDDPSVKDCSGNGTACSSSDGQGSTTTPATPKGCHVTVSDPAGLARVRSAASTSSDVLDELPGLTEVQVTSSVTGETVQGSPNWLQIRYRIGTEQKTGFVHNSLIRCP